MSGIEVMLQPAMSPDLRMPYPLFVSEDGSVGRQDVWNGSPAEVIGFTDRFDLQEVTLDFEEFWADPALAVGKYAVVRDADGSIGNNIAAIERVVRIDHG